jgi:hypothetical protein
MRRLPSAALVAHLTRSGRTEYVGRGPRPYTTVVFITSSTGGCVLCRELRPEMLTLANAFHKARFPEGAKEPAHNIFVVELDGAPARESHARRLSPMR